MKTILDKYLGRRMCRSRTK